METKKETGVVPGWHWVKDDGGRAAAGFTGKTGDCVCRAIAIATQMPYAQVYAGINQAAMRERPKYRQGRRSNARTGVFKDTTKRYMKELGWEWHPTMQIGQGCKTHLVAEELPKGRLVVQLSKHLCAVVDGVIHDEYDPSRGGTRCVYGYWTKE